MPNRLALRSGRQADSDGTYAPAVADDPVRARRDRMRRLASLGQRAGYLLYGVAVAAFVAAAVAAFPEWLVALTVAALLLGSILLAPAIVVAFGVRAADRADRDAGR